MAIDREGVAGVCLAGESRLTWVTAEVRVAGDDVVVVEVGGERVIGRVRIAPGAIIAGRVEPTGRIVAQADHQDLELLDSSLRAANEAAPRMGGVGRLAPPAGDAELAPLLDEFESALPRLGERVSTDRGSGVVARLALKEDMMKVRLDTSEEIEIPRHGDSG